MELQKSTCRFLWHFKCQNTGMDNPLLDHLKNFDLLHLKAVCHPRWQMTLKRSKQKNNSSLLITQSNYEWLNSSTLHLYFCWKLSILTAPFLRILFCTLNTFVMSLAFNSIAYFWNRSSGSRWGSKLHSSSRAAIWVIITIQLWRVNQSVTDTTQPLVKAHPVTTTNLWKLSS